MRNESALHSIIMAKKNKRFQAVKLVKEMAREQVGTPPSSRVVPGRKKKKSEKHKPTLEQILRESDS